MRVLGCLLLAGCTAFGAASKAAPAQTSDAGTDATVASPPVEDAGHVSDAGASPDAALPVAVHGVGFASAHSSFTLSVTSSPNTQVGDLLVVMIEGGDTTENTYLKDFTTGWKQELVPAENGAEAYAYVLSKTATSVSETFTAKSGSGLSLFTGFAAMFSIGQASGVTVLHAGYGSDEFDGTPTGVPSPLDSAALPADIAAGDALLALAAGHSGDGTPVSWALPLPFTSTSEESDNGNARAAVYGAMMVGTNPSAAPISLSYTPSGALDFAGFTLVVVRP